MSARRRLRIVGGRIVPAAPETPEPLYVLARDFDAEEAQARREHYTAAVVAVVVLGLLVVAVVTALDVAGWLDALLPGASQ